MSLTPGVGHEEPTEKEQIKIPADTQLLEKPHGQGQLLTTSLPNCHRQPRPIGPGCSFGSGPRPASVHVATGRRVSDTVAATGVGVQAGFNGGQISLVVVATWTLRWSLKSEIRVTLQLGNRHAGCMHLQRLGRNAASFWSI